jgi:hypothetical protein
MLEEMSETGPAALFVLGSHMIPDIDRDRGDRVVFMKNNLKAVGEDELLKVDLCKLLREKGCRK